MPELSLPSLCPQLLPRPTRSSCGLQAPSRLSPRGGSDPYQPQPQRGCALPVHLGDPSSISIDFASRAARPPAAISASAATTDCGSGFQFHFPPFAPSVPPARPAHLSPVSAKLVTCESSRQPPRLLIAVLVCSFRCASDFALTYAL